MTRANIYLPMAALILAALAIPAAAQQQIRFKGTFQGNDTVPCDNADICTSATGTATYLGQFSFTQELTVNGADLTDTGPGQWIAANGDEIDTAVVGFAVPGPDFFTVQERHTITGGTGRFSGVQGIFIVYRTHLALSDDGTHVTFAWFEGTITTPGAAH